MTPQTAAALAGKALELNVLYVVFGLFVIAGALTLIVTIGERALGFDLKRFINNVETRADGGDVWPGISLLLGSMALLGIILWIGLR